jgi:hypothetical protein
MLRELPPYDAGQGKQFVRKTKDATGASHRECVTRNPLVEA